MRKVNYFLSIVLVIAMPLMILFLSSNFILRLPVTYSFHFNDSEVMYDIPYNVSGNDMAGSIASYWSSFDKKLFQVYEDNGIFKDPIFGKDEQKVMQKAREIIGAELALGLLFLAVFAIIYIYLLKRGFKQALRNRFKAGAAFTVVLLVFQIVFLCLKPCRQWMYDRLIGIRILRTASLAIILGDPFFKTYLIFASLSGAVLLGIITYIHCDLTKPERIFY